MAKNKRATENTLGDLHAEFAKLLKDRLQNGEGVDDDGNPIPVKASTLNVIRQFLKDNEITALPVQGSPLGDLHSQLPEDFDFGDDEDDVIVRPQH